MKFSIEELKARSIPGHEYGFEGTGSQIQVVCSCNWRSKVWSKDNGQPVNEQWLAHVASKIPHKIVVIHEPGVDEAEVDVTWTLYKELDGEWQPCSREEPWDEAAFEAARFTNWYRAASGEYLLPAHVIAAAA